MNKHNPILLIHGAFSTPLSFRFLIDKLKSKRQEIYTVSYDVKTPLKDIIAQVDDYIHSFNGVKFNVVAHSLGGIIATMLANSGKVNKIITIGTPFNGSYSAIMMGIFSNHELFKSIEPTNPILATIKCMVTDTPVFNLITTEGNNPMIQGDNDAVVSIASQSCLNWTEKYTLPFNHTEVLLADETLNLIKNILYD